MMSANVSFADATASAVRFAGLRGDVGGKSCRISATDFVRRLEAMQQDPSARR
jgi:hypothetical protein